MKRKLLHVTIALVASMLSLNSWAQLSGYYQEDFEGTFPPPGWQTVDVLDAADVWEQSTQDVYSGYNSAHINFTNYVDGEDWLILPQFTVASADSFSFWFATDYAGYPPDQTDILISTTDSNLSSFTTTLASLVDGYNYPGIADAFQYYAYSLAPYAGQNIYVAFKHTDNYGDGVFIDLVSIGNQIQTVDAAAVSIDLPDFISTNTLSPMGTVKNNSIDVESFSATLSGPGYSSTMNVINLASGAIQQITFDPWTPATGVTTLTLSVSLAGDVDLTNDNITQDVSAFDPFMNYGWTVKDNAPISSYNCASAAINYTNGTSTVFMLGGSDGYYLLTDNHAFDAVSNSWSSLSSFPTATIGSNAAVIDGKIYMIGGYNYYYTGDNQIYDIANDSWSAGTPMPSPAGDYAFGVYHDSLLYYFGGLDLYSGIDYDLVQIYDPATDSWSNGTSIPVTGRGWQAGIAGNKIVLMGGVDDYTGYLTAATYVGTINPTDPTNISWTQVDDYPVAPIFRGASGGTIDPSSGLVVFTGGDPTGSGLTKSISTFAYDVNSNSWKIGPDKPTPANNLRNMSCAIYNDSMYMVSLGGYDGAAILDVNEWLNMGPAPVGTVVSENFSDNLSLVCFPNPFTRFTILSFKMKHSASVRISITDVTGKEVAVLCDKSLSAGDQQISWNASGYSAGVYFCNVNVDGNIVTQKLVKLK